MFQPCRVCEASEGWLSLLSLSWGLVLSLGQQSLGYGNATQTALNGSRTSLFQLQGSFLYLQGLNRSPHPPCTACVGHTASCLLQPLCMGRPLCLSAMWYLSERGNKSRENMEIALQEKRGDILQCWGQPLAALKPTSSLQISDNLCLRFPWFSRRGGQLNLL